MGDYVQRGVTVVGPVTPPPLTTCPPSTAALPSIGHSRSGSAR